MQPSDTAPSAAPLGRTPSGTALRSSAWDLFPGRDLTRQIGRIEQDAEQRIVRAIDRAQAGALDAVQPGWVRFLRRNMPVAAIAFRACGLLLEDAGGRCHFGPVSQGLSLQASMQLRQAQAIVLYAMDMEERFGDMPIEVARERWQADDRWIPVREFLEAVADLDDWGEQVVAVNLCYEPFVGQMMRRELVMGRGPIHGDPVTSVVAEAGQLEWALTQEWTMALIRFLLADTDHGEANRALLRGWLERQQPLALRACASIVEMSDQLPHPAPRGTSLSRVVADQSSLVELAGLSPGPLHEPTQPSGPGGRRP